MTTFRWFILFYFNATGKYSLVDSVLQQTKVRIYVVQLMFLCNGTAAVLVNLWNLLLFYILIEKLRKHFLQFGAVQDAVVMKDPVTRRSRGFGFITFADVASVDTALDNEPHTIDARKVYFLWELAVSMW